MPARRPKPQSKNRRQLTVGEFFERYGDDLQLSLHGDEIGFDRLIREPTINRPGLALAGFFTYFAFRRIQVIGNSESSYLNSLSPGARCAHFADLCSRDIPCIVVSRGKALAPELVSIAAERGITVFQTEMISMKFINAATIRLEWDFAPTQSEHGCMVDVKGIGVLIRGESGAGKSEAVLGLLERGASLVADDVVRLRSLEGRELVGTALEVGRYHMEVRGLGIINVPAMFGASSMRMEKRLDVVVTLRPLEALDEVERVGVRKRKYDILGIKVPHVVLPVAPGRDMARLVEVAALDQKLKTFGHDSAVEFDKKLLKTLAEKRKN